MDKQVHNNKNYVTTNCFMAQQGVFKTEAPFLNNLLNTTSNSVVAFKHKEGQGHHIVDTQAFIDIKNHNLFLNYFLNIHTQAEVTLGSVLFSFNYIAVYKLPGKTPTVYSMWYNQKRLTAYQRIHVVNLKNIIQTNAQVMAHLIKEASLRYVLNTVSTEASVIVYAHHNNVRKTDNVSTNATSYVSNISPYRNVKHTDQLATFAHLEFILHKAEHPTIEQTVSTTASVIGHAKFNNIEHIMHLTTHGQSDMTVGEDIFISKTEYISTSAHIQLLYTPSLVEHVINNIITDNTITTYKKDMLTPNVIHSLSTQVETSCAFVAGYIINHMLSSEASTNVVAMHNECTVENIIQTAVQYVLEKNIEINNTNNLLTNSVISITPLKLTSPLNELLTNATVLNYYKAMSSLDYIEPILSTDGTSIVYTYSNNIEGENFIITNGVLMYTAHRLTEHTTPDNTIKTSMGIEYYIKNETVEKTIYLTTHGQTDLKFGEDIFVSRTEILQTLSTSLLLYTPAIVKSSLVLDTDANIQTYYKDTYTELGTHNITTQYNQTYNFATYHNNVSSIINSISTIAVCGLQFDPIHTITLNKQNGVGGTSALMYINNQYITPTIAVPPTRDMYKHQGYYEESFTGDRLDWLAFVPTNSSTNKRISFETPYANGDEAVFLNNLYNNSSLWRIHAVIHSTHAITAFDVSDEDVTAQVITLSTSPNYTYLFDVAITEGMANYNASGTHYEFIDCVTNKDAIITFKDTWAYKKGYALIQRISADGTFTGLNQSTYNTNKTLYAQWTPRSIKVVWKNYAGTTLKTQNVYYEGNSDITPTVTTAPAGTSNSAQYTYTWPVNSYTITSEHTHREVITIQETRTVNKYTITWKNYVGTTLKTETIDYGGTSTAPTGTANTTQYTYSWPKSSTTVTGAETIQETRVTNKYTITWKNYAGTISKTETINYGTTSTAPTGTTNTAQYTYSWPKASTTVIGNETIQETRVVNKYTINFINYAGTTVSTQSVDYGTTPTIPNNTTNNTQYTYSWPTINTVTQAHNYNEIRTINQYTITWKNYAGDIVLTDTYNYGTVVNAPIGTSNTAGYTYSWPKASTTVVGNETIQELRTANTFTVTFNSNGGTTPSPVSKVVTYNILYGTLATTAKTDYSFLGWFTAQVGGSKILSSTNMLTTNNHTLWAHWNPANVYSVIEGLVTNGQTDIKFGENIFISRTEIVSTDAYMEYENQTIFTITLNKQNGVGGTNTIEGLTGVNITPASITAPTRTNYTFLGYYNQSSGGVKYINSNGTYNNLDSTTFIGDVTLYAQWSVVSRTTQWQANPATIGILADVYVNNVIKGTGVSTYSASQVADAIIKVKNHTVPPGWTYSTYTLSNLTSAVIGGSGNNIEVQATGDITKTGTRVLTTKFTAATYSITVNQNSGTGSSASISQYTPSATNTTTITMTKGTREGYRIIGWAVAGANGLASLLEHVITIPIYISTIQPYGAITVTPIWAPATVSDINEVTTNVAITYEAVHPITITLDKQSGTGGTNSIQSVKGFYTDPTTIVPPTRSGYTFGGYYTSTSGVGTQRINNVGVFINLTHNTYTVNTTLYAYWITNQYTINFNSDGGTIVNSITQNFGTPITAPTDPTKTGYTFTGWQPALPSTMPATNSTLTAQWLANLYNVTFNGNGGTSPSDKIVTFGGTYGTLTNSTQSNKQFLGWFTAASGGTKIISTTTVTVVGNHTLYAHWNPTQVEEITNEITTVSTTTTDYTPAIYNITTYKGTGVNTLSVTPATYSPSTNNQTITISRTASTGYSLLTATITRLGDYGGNTPTISGTTVTIPAYSYGAFRVDQTASANTYTLSFNSDGGSTPSPTSKSVTYNSAIGALPSDPTKTGYTFDGWYIGATKILSTTTWTYTSNQTAVAKWNAKTYEIYYDKVQSSVAISDPYKHINYGDTYGTPPTIIGGVAGYTHTGWEKSDGTPVTSSTVMNTAGDHTVYAVWTPNSFSITLNPNTGVAGSKSSIAVVYATSIDSFSTTMRPTKTGYTFKGFYTATSGGVQRISNTAYTALTSTTYSSAATLYAQWTPSTHSIYFNANGGSTPSPSSKIVTYGQVVGTLPTVTKTDSIFVGWFTSADVQITENTVWTYTSGQTLIAKWTLRQTAEPTLTTSSSGSGTSKRWYLYVRNNDIETVLIKYGTDLPPTLVGGDQPFGGVLQIQVATGNIRPRKRFYVTATATGLETSNVVSIKFT